MATCACSGPRASGVSQLLRVAAPGARPRLHARRPSVAAAASASSDGGAAQRPDNYPLSLGPWERVELARRKLQMAVAEERYGAAAEAKREVETLLERLPPSLALMAALLERLAAPGLPTEQAVACVQQLGELGEWAAALALAAALHEGEPLAGAAEEALWSLFLRCPSTEMGASMQTGVVLMRRPECWDQALALFDGMVAQAPTFAEGYNKRATVLYLQGRYAEAIEDCKVVLSLNPYHFMAASGMGLCCAAVGDVPGAIAGYQHALALNPRMRHLRAHVGQLQAQLAEERSGGEPQ